MKRFKFYRLLEESKEGNDLPGGNNEGGDDTSNRDKEIDDKSLGDDKKPDIDFDAIKKEIDDLKADKENRDKSTAMNEVLSGLKKSYKDFDSDKVRNKLIEMNKTVPGSGDKYNNPAGFELVWLKHFQTREVENDDFDLGRKEEEKFDFNETFEKAQNGDDRAMNMLFENSISTNHKY